MSKRIIFYDVEKGSEVEYKVSQDIHDNFYGELAFLAESGTGDVKFEKRPLRIRRG